MGQNDRIKVIAVTGHKPQKLGGYAAFELGNKFIIQGHMMSVLRKQQKKSKIKAITGMAIGIDQCWAEACLALGIEYTAAIPFKGQQLKWPAHVQERYTELLQCAQDVQVVGGDGTVNQQLYVCNEWIIQNCDQLVAYWDGHEGGGIAACVRYARNNSREVNHIDIFDVLGDL